MCHLLLPYWVMSVSQRVVCAEKNGILMWCLCQLIGYAMTFLVTLSPFCWMVCIIIEQRNSMVTCYNSYSMISVVLLVKLTGVKYFCDACKHCILLDKVNVLKNECEWSCSQGMFQLFTNSVFMTIPVRIKCRDLVKKIAIYRNRLAVRALTLPFSPPCPPSSLPPPPSTPTPAPLS